MKTRFKSVLISGIGIAGPTLAYWLKAAGFEPTLIERAPELRPGGYVIDFWGLGYDIAERMGLAGDINRIGYHMRELRIVDDRGTRVTGFGTKVSRRCPRRHHFVVCRTRPTSAHRTIATMLFGLNGFPRSLR